MMTSAEIVEDHLLFSKIKNGDEKAFKEVYYRYHRKIFLLAKSFLKDKDQSEEILQETFLNFWIRRDRFVIDKSIEPILYTICRRLVLDAFRKLSIIDRHKQNLKLMMSEVDGNTEDKIVFSDLLRITESAIAELPQQQQVVFKMSRYEGLSYDEIGIKVTDIKTYSKKPSFCCIEIFKI